MLMKIIINSCMKKDMGEKDKKINQIQHKKKKIIKYFLLILFIKLDPA